MRHTSTVVSFDTALVDRSISLMAGGSESVILTRPFWRRLLKSPALSPLVRKSSASTGPKQRIVGIRIPAAAPLKNWNRASAPAGESWKLSVGM